MDYDLDPKAEGNQHNFGASIISIQCIHEVCTKENVATGGGKTLRSAQSSHFHAIISPIQFL